MTIRALPEKKKRIGTVPVPTLSVKEMRTVLTSSSDSVCTVTVPHEWHCGTVGTRVRTSALVMKGTMHSDSASWLMSGIVALLRTCTYQYVGDEGHNVLWLHQGLEVPPEREKREIKKPSGTISKTARIIRSIRE